jgi:superfamily II DNA or RNA helicase
MSSGFADLEIKQSYATSTHDLINEFYEPVLSRAVRYDRLSGYFSSALISLVPLGYADYIVRGGKVRLLCSPKITPADYEVVRNLGEPMDDIETLLDGLRELAGSSNPEKQLLARIFSSLLASGILEMRIATIDMTGIYHDKKGIFEDEDGNCISFVGSANETAAAWSGFVNHEDIEVFNSLSSPADAARVANHVLQFDELWTGQRSGIVPIDVRVAEDEIFNIVEPEPIEEILKRLPRIKPAEDKPIPLYDYQLEVLKSWEEHGRSGVVCFATGGGKTLTCIEALKRWTKTGAPALVLVPTEYLLHQWANEVEKWFPAADVLLVGGQGNGSDRWGPYLSAFTAAQTGDAARVVISTYASARSAKFRAKIRTGAHLMVAADEVHNFGSNQNRDIALWLETGARMGLSATPERKWDPVGTQSIFDYFGEKLSPAFSLEDALDAKVLCEYDYFFEKCELTAEEDAEWEALTVRYVRAWLAAGKKMTKQVTDLLIARSRIAKAALNKTEITVNILKENFTRDDRWLVYCESISHLNEVSQAIQDAKIPNLQVLEYHSRNSEDHSGAIKFLTQSGGVMLAVKCLDEGVDLPRVNKAIIMASSTNPREYIQRRGRVLRRHPEKKSAQIYDILTFRNSVDEPTTCGEISRSALFSRTSRNRATGLELDRYEQLCKLKEQIPEEIDEDLEDA